MILLHRGRMKLAIQQADLSCQSRRVARYTNTKVTNELREFHCPRHAGRQFHLPHSLLGMSSILYNTSSRLPTPVSLQSGNRFNFVLSRHFNHVSPAAIVSSTLSPENVLRSIGGHESDASLLAGYNQHTSFQPRRARVFPWSLGSPAGCGN